MASMRPDPDGWKVAMAAEFEEAVADGHGLTFAAECLTTAGRALPTHIEGRLTLASYTVVLGLLLPLAALLLMGTMSGYPYVHPAYANMIGVFAKAETIVPRVNAGNAAAVPALTILLMLRVGADILVAWFAAERDWRRAAAAQRWAAAATLTLAMLAGLVVLDETCAVLPAFTFAVEALAITLLRQWHGESQEAATMRG
jgi:uncharacterized membrane protein YphA (DoxX/SURF4 family)